MLVAAIDRSKATDSEKMVERIISASKSLPALRIEEPSGFNVPSQKRKGIILRNGDKRNNDRRHRVPESIQSLAQQNSKERRHQNNRAPHTKWSSQTHEIIIIAVEKEPNAQRKWNVGEEVVVSPSSTQEKLSARPSVPSQFKRSTPLVNEENDFIVSLSRSLGKKI
ncbi:MAG: hypothetical protein O3A78_00690 [Nitrospinae bacterium]|jgi:hypothetical protein|nr:hypothetical protein [Nitrospinota bacterium]MDA1108324.1 hypothetical protein [Nitrospinota bacterium]